MRVALVGNPNAGKTTLFNQLTGLHQHVANWPGTTVEYAAGDVFYAGRRLRLTDLPGVQALAAYADDERVTLHFLLREAPDVVLLVADASRLERSLFLALECLEFSARAVVALNKVDVAEAHGIRVDGEGLAERLGVPVVPVIAHRRQGVDRLLDAVLSVGSGELSVAPARLRYGSTVESAVAAVAARLSHDVGMTAPVRWTALRLLQGDVEVLDRARGQPEAGVGLSASATDCHSGARVLEVERCAPGQIAQYLNGLAPREAEFALEIADTKYEQIHDLVAAHVRRADTRQPDWTSRLDALALHPLAGPVWLALVFGSVFWLSFQASAPASDVIGAGIDSAGRWLSTALAALGAPAWAVSLLLDGVLAGVGAVLSFVPYMAVFFAAMAFVELSGYMARAALLGDRVMQALGLHGKSLFPLVSAFGCNVPALTATRGLENRLDRLVTGLVIPFVPCNARLGVMAIMAGALFHGGAAGVAMLGLIAISLLVVAVTALAYRRALSTEDPAPLLLDLPPYALPRWQDVAIPALQHCYLFIRRIWRFLVPATVLVWALAYFPVGVPPEASYAGRIGSVLETGGRLLGFDWRLMVAIMFGFVAKETTLGILGVLYGMTDSAPLADALAASMTPLVGFTFLVVYMLYVPCLATVVQLRRELGSWRWAAAGIFANVTVAILVGALVTWIGLFWQAGR